MQVSTFNKIRNIVYDISRISLSDDKFALVNARVSKRMRELGMTDHKQYLKYVMEDDSGIELQHLMDAISTNVTSFYRESDHFDFMREVLKKWLEKDLRKLRIWSAACSTGEEPYTIAIEVKKVLNGKPVNTKILATDISKAVIKTALEGSYSEETVAPVSKGMRNRYFTKIKYAGSNGILKVKDEIKNMITFRMFNLSSMPFPMKGLFDIIFCRNVMIYFDRKFRSELVLEFHRLLKPGGYLIVGHAESVAGMSNGFKTIKPSIYIKD